MAALRLILLVLTIALGAAPAFASYDALGNLRSRSEGTGSLSTMNYDATNRVASATIFGQNRTFAYDARGNTTNNGNFAFVYDFANQPTSVSGAASAAPLPRPSPPKIGPPDRFFALRATGFEAYDANLKRVKIVSGGATTYTMYSRVTGGVIFRDEPASPAGTLTDYVSAGGASFRLKKIGAAAAVPEYIHADWQGSPIAGRCRYGQRQRNRLREQECSTEPVRLRQGADKARRGTTGERHSAKTFRQQLGD